MNNYRFFAKQLDKLGVFSKATNRRIASDIVLEIKRQKRDSVSPVVGRTVSYNIYSCFIWNHSIQGHDYWRNLTDKLPDDYR